MWLLKAERPKKKKKYLLLSCFLLAPLLIQKISRNKNIANAFPVQKFYKHLLLFFPIFSVIKKKVLKKSCYLSNLIDRFASHRTIWSFEALDYFLKTFHFSTLGKLFHPDSTTSLRDGSLVIMVRSSFNIYQWVFQNFVLISLLFTVKDFAGLNCNLYANESQIYTFWFPMYNGL